MTLRFEPEGIEEYAERHSDPQDPLLDELEAVTLKEKGELARMQVGRLEGAFLRTMVRATGARRVLEIGMFTGCSALWMASGLPDDGELVTCDVDPVAERIAKSFFARSPHGKKIQVRMGPAAETLATLEGPFDAVFIDADKGGYARYWELSLPLVRPGGLLMVDNVLWSGKVLKPQTADDHALVAFNAMVARDPRVERVVATVRDGVTLAVKK